MQAFFGVIGSYVSGSGFEDIIYQLGLCQPGTMKAMLKGKHYNQAWLIHESFSEAVSRLFIDRHIPVEVLENINMNCDVDIQDILADNAFMEYVEYYKKVMREGLTGKFGKTSQYWLRYVFLVDLMHKLHFAIKDNNF